MQEPSFSNGKVIKRVATVGEMVAELSLLPPNMGVRFSFSDSHSIELILIGEVQRPCYSLKYDLHILEGGLLGNGHSED